MEESPSIFFEVKNWRRLLLGPLCGTFSPGRECRVPNSCASPDGKPKFPGALHYKKDTWPVVAIRIFGDQNKFQITTKEFFYPARLSNHISYANSWSNARKGAWKQITDRIYHISNSN